MKSVRVSAKAIIVQDGKLLAIKCRDADGDYFVLPGGGQEYGETLPDALQRECREETGFEVSVGELVLVREYRGWRHEFRDDQHAIELMFACVIKGRDDGIAARNLDKAQIGIEWLDLGGLEANRLYPMALRGMLASLGNGATPPIYCGDVN